MGNFTPKHTGLRNVVPPLTMKTIMNSVESPSVIKHAGAGWLKDRLKHRNASLSEFGVKVANVLGQVYLGIYHIYEYVLKEPLMWAQTQEIKVKMHRELATYDGRELSMLAFCCEAAGIKVSINPSSYMYLQLVFTEDTEPVDRSFDNTHNLTNLPSKGSFLPIVKVTAKTKFYTYYSARALNFSDVLFLVDKAHESCTRVAISRRSNSTISLMASPRKSRAGELWQRHPTLCQHKTLLTPYINIDYLEI